LNIPATQFHAESVELGAEERRAELEQARRLAERYRLEFVDMDSFRIDQDLFRSIPADLMLRYGFVPYRREAKTLVIVVSDPSDLPMIDELAVPLSTPIKVTVGSRSAIESILKKSESSQRARGGGHRGLPAAAAEGKRTATKPHRRASDERHQSGHQARRLDDLYGHSAAGERHPHRNAG
jgi:hypothetical protein